MANIYAIGMTCLYCSVLISNAKIILISHTFKFEYVLSIVISTVSFPIIYKLENSSDEFDIYGTYDAVESHFILNLILLYLYLILYIKVTFED